MSKDLTSGSDMPLWPLSSYGPAKNEPNLLVALDESPEELRVRAATASRSNNIQDYVGALYRLANLAQRVLILRLG